MSEKKEIIAYLVVIIVAFFIAQHMNVVVSESMEPVLYRGDIVIVEKSNLFGINEFDPNEVEVGDIVVYNATWFPNPVIHRVIDVSYENGTKYFTIQGDNNLVEDPELVSPSQITERVVKIGNQPIIIPKVGYITIWLKGL
ncbi:MAG: signal peptidase I [Methanobrevibacter sp.]|nr:signal peptidase I [Methanobrevibacter sp.]